MHHHHRSNSKKDDGNGKSSQASGGGKKSHQHHQRRPSSDSTASSSSYESHSSSGSSSTATSTTSTKKNSKAVGKRIPWRPSNNCPSYRPSSQSRVHPASTVDTSNGRVNRNRHHHSHPQQLIPPRTSFVALDCEMVGVGPGGYESSCAKVTIVDWNGQTLLDAYIQQTQEVTDYRTFVSGITPQILKNATMTLEGCRIQVIKILQTHPILVGHALKNDLEVLGITHPWWLIRDTALYEPFMRLHHRGMLCPRKLKELCTEKLSRNIQVQGQPHSPYEDAIAALDLYKSVQVPWESLVNYQMDQARRSQTMMARQYQPYHNHHQQNQYYQYPQQHRPQQHQRPQGQHHQHPYVMVQ